MDKKYTIDHTHPKYKRSLPRLPEQADRKSAEEAPPSFNSTAFLITPQHSFNTPYNTPTTSPFNSDLNSSPKNYFPPKTPQHIFSNNPRPST
jgi:hypothetical protein